MTRQPSTNLPISEATTRLVRRLGKNVVHTDEHSLYHASYDGMKVAFMPSCVIRATTPEHVGATLKLANQHAIPVTTQGGQSSLTGSATPTKGGWVLNTTGLNHLRIDKAQGIADVGAGCNVASIKKAANKKNWHYPPDPSSVKYCTIGGNIACNAGGLSGAKYGVTRDYILGLEGYLPTGEPVRWAAPLRKWAVGYNVRDLWIGSEGTLGVVTRAWLRLLAKPETSATALAAFKTEEAALKAVRALMSQQLTPCALEFLDRESVRGVETHTGRSVFRKFPSSALLLIELDGTKAEVERDSEHLQAWGTRYANAFQLAHDAEEARNYWDVRRMCSPAMFAHGDSKLNEDIVVPLQSQATLVRLLRRLRKESRLHIPTFGHAADGNFHVNIMYTRNDKAQCKAAEKAVKTLMREVVDMGGAISGEHGIGLAKSSYLNMQCGKTERETMQRIKEVFDPHHILNPHKIFEPCRVWKYTPESIQLPWDHR